MHIFDHCDEALPTPPLSDGWSDLIYQYMYAALCYAKCPDQIPKCISTLRLKGRERHI